jgi:DNA-binding MarR family transcriptional regulator
MTEPFYSVATLDPGKSVGFLLKRCGILMSQLAERRFASEPVSFTQWFVLANLSRFDHLSATALSSETGYDMGALTRIVDDLESKDLVRRGRSEHDRRAIEIALTPSGRRRTESGKRVVVELLNLLVTPYSRQELEALIELLQRMLEHLHDAVGDDAPRRGSGAGAPRTRRPRRARSGDAS